MTVFQDFDILPRFDRAVATVGSFDGVHRGHQLVLDRLRTMAGGEGACRGGAESVVITFSPHPREVLGGALHLDGVPCGQMPLLTTPPEKAILLERAGVDSLVVMPFTRELAGRSAADFMAMLASMGIVRLVAGFNQRFGHDRMPAHQISTPGGFTIEIGMQLPEINVSSTVVRRLIASGDMNAAAQLLGYYYFVAGQWTPFTNNLSVNNLIIDGLNSAADLPIDEMPVAEFIPLAPGKLLPSDGYYATNCGTVTLCGGRIFASRDAESLSRGEEPNKLSFLTH